MKKIILCSILLVSFPIMGNAATLEWDRNTESDVLDYQVYACFTPNCVLLKSSTTLQSGNILQSAVGTKPSYVIDLANKEGMLGVVARDTSLNESGLSVLLPFDRIAPLSPLNPRLR